MAFIEFGPANGLINPARVKLRTAQIAAVSLISTPSNVFVSLASGEQIMISATTEQQAEAIYTAITGAM